MKSLDELLKKVDSTCHWKESSFELFTFSLRNRWIMELLSGYEDHQSKQPHIKEKRVVLSEERAFHPIIGMMECKQAMLDLMMIVSDVEQDLIYETGWLRV